MRQTGDVPGYWNKAGWLVQELTVAPSKLPLRCGDSVYLYEAGPLPSEELILVSPAESPFLVVARLLEQLAHRYRVTAWDNPASPFMDRAVGLAPLTIERAAANLVDVLEERGAGKPHIVTWCSGALVALWAIAALRTVSVSSVSFIAPPSILARSLERTAFQVNFIRMILELASGAAKDEADLCKRIRAMRGDRLDASEEERRLYEITDLLLRDEDSIKRYAKLIQSACIGVPPSHARTAEQAYGEILSGLAKEVPVAFFHCKDDSIVSYRCSLDAAVSNDARLVLYPVGGHFAPFTNAAMLAADIQSFISKAPFAA